jgi:hypothetical protein
MPDVVECAGDCGCVCRDWQALFYQSIHVSSSSAHDGTKDGGDEGLTPP